MVLNDYESSIKGFDIDSTLHWSSWVVFHQEGFQRVETTIRRNKEIGIERVQDIQPARSSDTGIRCLLSTPRGVSSRCPVKVQYILPSYTY